MFLQFIFSFLIGALIGFRIGWKGGVRHQKNLTAVEKEHEKWSDLPKEGC